MHISVTAAKAQLTELVRRAKIAPKMATKLC
jgi:hypothetical protein